MSWVPLGTHVLGAGTPVESWQHQIKRDARGRVIVSRTEVCTILKREHREPQALLSLIPGLTTRCVPLSKSLTLSELWFPLLQNGEDDLSPEIALTLTYSAGKETAHACHMVGGWALGTAVLVIITVIVIGFVDLLSLYVHLRA